MDTHYHQVPDSESVRAQGVHVVVTPEECVELVRRAERDEVLVNFKPLMGGMPPELGWESLELFVNKVVPLLEAGRPAARDTAAQA